MKPSALLALTVVLAAAGGCGRAPRTVVLFDGGTPEIKPRLPLGECRVMAIERFTPRGALADTVILAGHSLPPTYAGQSAALAAEAIASFRPRLVVLDTCYGASTPILDALARTGLDAWVVAAPYRIPFDGFAYAEGFLGEMDAERQAGMVHTEPRYPLLKWRLQANALADLHRQVAALPASERARRLKRVAPALIVMPLPTALDPGGQVLVPVPR